MDFPEPVRVRSGTWERDGAVIRAVRNAVFTAEQGIPESVDLDGRDHACVHVLAVSGDGQFVGTARMLADGHVGRIAVLRAWRGQGVGTRMIEFLTNSVRVRRYSEIYLHSQTQAAAFYARMGFEARGEPFIEAGIEHILMVRKP